MQLDLNSLFSERTLVKAAEVMREGLAEAMEKKEVRGVFASASDMAKLNGCSSLLTQTAHPGYIDGTWVLRELASDMGGNLQGALASGLFKDLAAQVAKLGGILASDEAKPTLFPPLLVVLP